MHLELPNGLQVTFTISWWYILCCFSIVLVIRGILCAFKAWAIRGREHIDKNTDDSDNKEDEDLCNKSFKRQTWIAFLGFTKYKSVNDYCLPVIIGLFEISAYPILIYKHEIKIIGAWLVIKSVGGWKVWGNSRTAFNRFLVGNLLALFFSFLLAYLIKVG